MTRITLAGLFIGMTLAGCAQPPNSQSAYVPMSMLYAQSCGQISDQIATLRKITEDKGCAVRSTQAPISISTTPRYTPGAQGAEPSAQAIPAAQSAKTPLAAPATALTPPPSVQASASQAVTPDAETAASPARSMMSLDDAIKACEALSVPTGTEQFGKCVLTLSGSSVN